MVNFCLNMNPPLNFSIYDFLPVLSLLPDLSLSTFSVFDLNGK